eukprot:Nitzschia sp. Nitz4//scaffold51_size120721//50471//52142//NITZ4_003726-RA/size120721-snap-gene-0.37-mRNA-1//-1//CDS//3329553859//7586//frame0
MLHALGTFQTCVPLPILPRKPLATYHYLISILATQSKMSTSKGSSSSSSSQQPQQRKRGNAGNFSQTLDAMESQPVKTTPGSNNAPNNTVPSPPKASPARPPPANRTSQRASPGPVRPNPTMVNKPTATSSVLKGNSGHNSTTTTTTTTTPLKQPPTVQQENSNLKQQLDALKRKMLLMQRQMKQHGIPVDISLTNHNKMEKDHQSVSADDDQETVEPMLDLDSHQSAKGLKHRGVKGNITPRLNQPTSGGTVKQPLRHTTIELTPTNTKSESFSSLEDLEDEVLKQPHLPGSEQKVASVDEDDLDDTDHVRQQQERRLLSEPDGIMEEPGGSTPTEDEEFWECVSDRASWLVGLMVFQSFSSFILARNEALLQQHAVIVRFLTMLVGAGGNAGNQACVRVIRGLAVGTISDGNTPTYLRKEFAMGLALSIILGVSGCIRTAVFMTPLLETIAITASLFMIVAISIVLGALLPLGMKRLGIDPAHSSTTIQVVMDITGVTITVWMSALILNSGWFGISDEQILEDIVNSTEFLK